MQPKKVTKRVKKTYVIPTFSKNRKVVKAIYKIKREKVKKMPGKTDNYDTVVKSLKPLKRDNKILYIPTNMPERKRINLLKPPTKTVDKTLPQFKNPEHSKKKYKDPSAYGMLPTYTKEQLLRIAVNDYDLIKNKQASGLSKSDIIKFIKKRFKYGDVFKQETFSTRELKIRPLEPVRQGVTIVYTPPISRNNIYGGILKVNKLIIKGDQNAKLTPMDMFNKMQKDDPKFFPNVKPFGKVRKLNKESKTLIDAGDIDSRQLMLNELATHLDISLEERLNLHKLSDEQISKIYKKIVNQFNKPEGERFSTSFRVNELKFTQNNAPNFSIPPQITGHNGTPNFVSKQKQGDPAIEIFKNFGKNTRGLGKNKRVLGEKNIQPPQKKEEEEADDDEF